MLYKAEDEAEKAAVLLIDLLIDYSMQHTASCAKTLDACASYELDLARRFIGRTIPGLLPQFDAALARGRAPTEQTSQAG